MSISIVYAAVGLIGRAERCCPAGMTVGVLTCFLSYANQYTKPFNEISGVVTELQNAIACAARVFELIDEPAQIPDAAERGCARGMRRATWHCEHVAFSLSCRTRS